MGDFLLTLFDCVCVDVMRCDGLTGCDLIARVDGARGVVGRV